MFVSMQTPSCRAVVLFACVALLGGCASPGDSSAPSGLPAAERTVSPPSAAVTRSQAWRDAEALAAMEPGRFTVIGAGASMRPVYGENTVIVLQKVAFDELAAGMSVAYRGRSGRIILHRLVAPEAGGWRAVGLNNELEDPERVTPANLIGAVYAVFANEDVR